MHYKKDVAICEGTNEIINNRLSYIEAKGLVSLSPNIKKLLKNIFLDIEEKYRLTLQINLKNDEKKISFVKFKQGIIW